MIATLCEPGVGLVTSVIVGAGERSFGAALENLQLLAHVAPGVVSGDTLIGKPISVGKSMAMWAADLRAVGGFEAVSDAHAELIQVSSTEMRRKLRAREDVSSWMPLSVRAYIATHGLYGA